MSDQEINIAIAEACGWTEIHTHPSDGMLWGQHPSCPDERNEYYDYPIPDCCHDLNAMHEAEKVMSDDQYHTGYKQTLASLVGLSGNMRVPSATARQRAEAFLRTIGKWKEAK